MVLVAALLTARLLLPTWVAHALNERLAQIQGYDAALEQVDLYLYRGAYRIHDLRVVAVEAEDGVPLLHLPVIDLSVSWRHVLRGALVGEIVLHSPLLNLVDRPDADVAPEVADDGRDWRNFVESFFPLRIDEIRVHDGSVAFLNLWSDPEVDVRLEAVDGWVRNLTNVRDAQGRREAELHVDARLTGESPLEVRAQFDPWETIEDFEFALRVSEVDLTRLNDLARAYLNLDFASGRGELVMELEAENRRLSGYIKPLLHDLKIFDLEQDVRQGDGNPLQVVWEAAAELITRIFRNHPKDRFATRISIEGRIDDPQMSTWEAVLGVLRNAFGEAIEAHFEGEGVDGE